MALFKSKKLCPVCGKPTPLLLKTKIEGQPLCSDCAQRIEMDYEILENLSLEALLEHFSYLDSRAGMRSSFATTKEYSFGFISKLLLDSYNKLICTNITPDREVYKGSELDSFIIREDGSPIFRGSASGLEVTPSAVPERVKELQLRIDAAMISKEIAAGFADNREERMEAQRRSVDIPEPFKKFFIELNFNTPYRKKSEFDIAGPTFDYQSPSVQEYMAEYRTQYNDMAELASMLMDIAFPSAPKQAATQGASQQAASQQAAPQQAAPQQAAPMQAAPMQAAPVDAVTELKRYKDLCDSGIITEEEFAAKKKQLLGI